MTMGPRCTESHSPHLRSPGHWPSVSMSTEEPSDSPPPPQPFPIAYWGCCGAGSTHMSLECSSLLRTVARGGALALSADQPSGSVEEGQLAPQKTGLASGGVSSLTIPWDGQPSRFLLVRPTQAFVKVCPWLETHLQRFLLHPAQLWATALRPMLLCLQGASQRGRPQGCLSPGPHLPFAWCCQQLRGLEASGRAADCWSWVPWGKPWLSWASEGGTRWGSGQLLGSWGFDLRSFPPFSGSS